MTMDELMITTMTPSKMAAVMELLQQYKPMDYSVLGAAPVLPKSLDGRTIEREQVDTQLTFLL